MKKRCLSWTVIACLLTAMALLLHGWNKRIHRIGEARETALALIRVNYLDIKIGEDKPWRPILEKLLTERYGLYFPPRYPEFCRQIEEPEEVLQVAFDKIMNEAIAKRFAPGELERVAEEAERIHRESLADVKARTNHP